MSPIGTVTSDDATGKLGSYNSGVRSDGNVDNTSHPRPTLLKDCDCANCPFAKAGQPNRPVLAEGSLVPSGVLVGESPGRDDVDTGRPLAGPAGRQLDEELAAAGLQRQRLFVINAVACQPPIGKNEKRMEKAVRCCAPAFKAQLAQLSASAPGASPPPILAMGRWAASAVLGRAKGVMNTRGFVRQHEGRTVIVTYSPGFAFFKNPYEWAAFTLDLERFVRAIHGALRPGPTWLLTRPTEADILRLHAAGVPVAVDIETGPESNAEPWTGKQPTRAKLRTVGLGTPDIGLSHQWGTDHTVEQAIRALLADERVVKVFHNGTWFDLPVLRRHGCPVK